MILTPPTRRARHVRDAYFTPRAFVDKALDLVPGTPASILDPGAGEGVWGEGAAARWPKAWIAGVEIQPGFPACVREGPRVYDEWVVDDYLTMAEVSRPFDLVIGNPPFSQAEAFVRRSLDLLAFGGTCVFLLRLAFLEGKARGAGLFKEHPPYQVSVCSSRPSFYNDRSGATAFCYIVFRKAYKGETRLTWSVP